MNLPRDARILTFACSYPIAIEAAFQSELRCQFSTAVEGHGVIAALLQDCGQCGDAIVEAVT
jgi:hypothetical protein